MTGNRRVSLRELLSFFVPLAVTWMLMMFTHTIISAGLSRTTDPTVSTAAYAVALSLAAIAEAPLVMMRQVALTFVQSRQTFKVVMTVLSITLGCFMLIVFGIGYILPLGRFVFQGLLGVSDALFPAAMKAFRVAMFLPLTSGIRCLYQGVIMVRRRTTCISTGMFIRVSFMVILVFSFTRLHLVTGPLVGAITLVGGIAVEGMMAWHYGRKLIPEGETTVTPGSVWQFYLPLIASSLMVSTGKPFINAGLARMPDAAVALAAFSVASSFAWVIISPSQNIQQLTMVFGRMVEDRQLVRRFAAIFAAISSATLLIISFGPLGRFILSDLIQVPVETLQPTLISVRVLAFFPLIICWLEYNTGILLLAQSARLVGIGKAVNLFATIGFVLFIAPSLPGSVAAPLAQLVGFGCEGLILQSGRFLVGHVASRRQSSAA